MAFRGCCYVFKISNIHTRTSRNLKLRLLEATPKASHADNINKIPIEPDCEVLKRIASFPPEQATTSNLLRSWSGRLWFLENCTVSLFSPKQAINGCHNPLKLYGAVRWKLLQYLSELKIHKSDDSFSEIRNSKRNLTAVSRGWLSFT